MKGRLDLAVSDLGPKELKNIAEPIRVYSLEIGKPAQAKPAPGAKPPEPKKRSRVALLSAGIAALGILIAAAPGISSAPIDPRPSPTKPRPRRRAFPSSLCPSPISPAIRRRITSPTP